MSDRTGFIEIDMFSKEIDSEDHPDALRFRELLEDVADEYRCHLISFEIDSGTVIFSFNNDELMAEIVNILKNEEQNKT